MTNEEIADRLEEVADLLEQQPQANIYRVAAYREGATTVRQNEEPITELLRRDGRAALQNLHGIGEGLAGSIEELVETGRLGLLDRLREQTQPEAVFETLSQERQVTVVTSAQGVLKGRRAVRGREQECLRYYRQ